MAINPRIDLVKGARWPIPGGTVALPSGDALAMTNGDPLVTADITSVTLKIWDTTADAGTYLVDRAVSSFAVADGAITWTYEPTADDTAAVVAKFSWQLEITLSDGRIGYAPSVPGEHGVGGVYPVVGG